jgi:hypothetical protein
MKQCAICGKVIEHPGNRTKYCSEQCCRKAEAKKQIKVISYRASRRQLIAHNVYRAYGHKCAICQWQASENLVRVNGRYQYSHGNEIHHITPVSEGGTDEDDNIILLCPNHHKLAGMGLISREELRTYTRPLAMTEEEKRLAIEDCSEAVARAIFTEE